jgi:hypothetical protein
MAIMLRHALALVLALWATLFASGCAYRPGSLLTTPAPSAATTAHTVECLDLSVTLAADVQLPASSTRLHYRFGNRCAAPVTLDLGAAAGARGPLEAS